MSDSVSLSSFKAKDAYRSRSMDELDSLSGRLNDLKDRMSEKVGWYLRRYIGEYDIPRLCRALAAPDAVSMDIMKENGMWPEVDLSIGEAKSKIEEVIDVVSDRIPPYIRGAQKKYQARDVVYRDLKELGVYMKMYLNVGKLKSRLDEDRRGFEFYTSQFSSIGGGNRLVPETEYDKLNGNPFEEMMEIMKTGAVIVRFKYVSDGSSWPEERIVSYHLSDKDQSLVGIHVQGDGAFSGSGVWGHDDGKIVWSPEYSDRTVRWGKKECLLESIGLRYRDSYCY